MRELEKENPTGKEKNDWERAACKKIYEAVDLNVSEDDVKFCKRIGEKGREPRPLVVGFYSERDRNQLLRRAKLLDRTEYRDVQISQDLTKRQREEESDMRCEAEKRNGELSEEDKAKNLQWAVVGARGEKRLIKTTARDQQQQGFRGRGRGRPPLTHRPTVWSNTNGPQTSHQASRQVEAMEEETTTRRGGVRRARSDDEEEETRPGKK